MTATRTARTSGYRDLAEELLSRDRWGMLIGGEIVGTADGEVAEDRSPADGRALALVPDAQPADVDRAVTAARSAFPYWRATPVAERARVVTAIAATVRGHATELGILDALDSGNPASAMIGEAELAASWLEWCAGAASRVVGETVPGPRDQWLMTRHEPYGVVARLTAYNHPLLFAAQKIGAPLVTGNTLVLKPADQTPLAPLRLGELLAEAVPPGVVNIITGTGQVAGDALVRHPRVKRISLIGSVRTGQRIQIAAAESGIKHVSLELGGKNPMIVLPDVDPAVAAQAAVAGMNFAKSLGQSCGSCSRLFLPESIADAVVAGIAGLCAELRQGHPLDPGTDVGCMVSPREQERVLAMIEAARTAGAELVCGGGIPPGLEEGAYIAPTVFDHVNPAMAIARKEIFGPVLSVLRYRDLEEAVRVADSVNLGLTASVWTNDLHTALTLADRLDAGYVWVNDAGRHFDGVPFSGHRDSGTDSEEGIGELYSFTQPKTVAIGLGQRVSAAAPGKRS